MGQEVKTQLRWDGRILEGTALLETDALIFRGGASVSVPFSEMWSVEANAGWLELKTARGLLLLELVELTEWKMARGVWRAPNLVLVKGNDADVVKKTTAAALASAPHPTAPVATLAKLAGVGPATASALVAAAEPATYPFFDELVAAQVPGLGAVKWTMSYYARYAEGLRARAQKLGDDWTPVLVERALWASVGGKAGRAALAGLG